MKKKRSEIKISKKNQPVPVTDNKQLKKILNDKKVFEPVIEEFSIKTAPIHVFSYQIL